MKTTVQALKELYATLGGNLADVALIERIPEMIEALNSIAVAVPAPTAEDEGKVMTVGEDGALGFDNALPPVTSADAGKVLTVSDAGAWEAAAASGGGMDIFEVNITTPISAWPTTSAIGYITTDKTNVEIRAALEAGKKVMFFANEKTFYALANNPSNPIVAVASIMIFSGDAIMCYQISYNTNNVAGNVYFKGKVSFDT